MSSPIFDLKLSKELQEVYQRTMRELNEFFGNRWERNLPSVFIAPTRKILGVVRGEPMPDWVVGTRLGSRVAVVLAFEEIRRTKGKFYNKERFYKLIKHELCHCFIDILAGPNKPRWVEEGVSLYVAGQLEYYKEPEKFAAFLNEKDLKGVYKESVHAVRFLVEKYGKQKLLDFLRLLKDKKAPTAFKEIYEKPLSYKTFNELLSKAK